MSGIAADLKTTWKSEDLRWKACRAVSGRRILNRKKHSSENEAKGRCVADFVMRVVGQKLISKHEKEKKEERGVVLASYYF